MKKSTLAKIGTLAAGSLITGSAFAFELSFEPKVAAPKVAAPQVNVAPGTVAMPKIQVAPTAIGGFSGAFKTEEVAKAGPIGSCQAGLPKQLADASGVSEIRVNELFAKHILNESSCETGLGEAGKEAQQHLVIAADKAEQRGILSATADQGRLIAGESLVEAFRNEGVTMAVEEAADRMDHVASTCGWFNYPARAASTATNGSVN